MADVGSRRVEAAQHTADKAARAVAAKDKRALAV